jgi:hypothetical protein
MIEGIGLAADEEPAGLATIGDLVFGAQGDSRGQDGGVATHRESKQLF